MRTAAPERKRDPTVRRVQVALVLVIGLLIGAAPTSAETIRGRAPTAPTAPWTPGAAQYGLVRVDDVQITMSDGVRLQADVYYPADLVTGLRALGKFPVVLAMTPYRKRSS